MQPQRVAWAILVLVIATIGSTAKPAHATVGQVPRAVYRPSNGQWYTYDNPSGTWWGNPGDIPVAGDYNGDGSLDIAVYRPSSGYWFFYPNGNGTWWGNPGDIPVPGDYDFDGKTDIAVYRPSNGYWYIINSSNQSITSQWWGVPGDVPITGNFLGNGRFELTVYRPSNGYWYEYDLATGTNSAIWWGLPGDIPAPGDYDGNGFANIAVYRPSNGGWYVQDPYSVTIWGVPGDMPVPGDYDGVGHAQFVVFRPSNGYWYTYPSGPNVWWGWLTDTPITAQTGILEFFWDPPTTHSRYVGDDGTQHAGDIGAYSLTQFTDLGCQRAQLGDTGAIILAFGRPNWDSATGYGVQAPGGVQPDWSISDVEYRVRNFVFGYSECAVDGQFATILVGTSNLGPHLDAYHAAEWADLLNRLQQWSITYYQHIAVAAAFDAEVAFNTASATRSWISAYTTYYTAALYDFGDAAGCPQYADFATYSTGQTSQEVACQSGGWTQDDVWWVSWGASPAHAFPEIYVTCSPSLSCIGPQAVEWERISQYAQLHYGPSWRIHFSGVLTQYNACREEPSQCAPDTDNDPAEGYLQLWRALRFLDAGANADDPEWLSDMHWRR